MNNKNAQNTESVTAKRSSFYALLLFGFILLALTIAVAYLAQSFPYAWKSGRPIVTVVILSWIASAVSLAAVFIGLTVERSQQFLVTLIVLFAITFRLILVFSNPILEVDYYRYLWDGIAANQNVSAFKHSPESVLGPAEFFKKSDKNGNAHLDPAEFVDRAGGLARKLGFTGAHSVPIVELVNRAEQTPTEPSLQKLQNHIAENESAKTIVSRVHFNEFTTLYPPVSQFFFRLTTALVPDDASVETHITSLKFMLMLFDLGIVFCLVWILKTLDKHPAWLITYAWNPLVLKEISNGGHLDSIAIFFMTAGIALFLWFARRWESNKPSAEEKSLIASGVSGSLMGLGIGAKLFPVVLMPALLFYLVVKKQFSAAFTFTIACAAVAATALLPMVQLGDSNEVADQPSEQIAVTAEEELDDGLTAFLTRWRMNDVIFSLIYQNVEYNWSLGDDQPWYVFVSNDERKKWYPTFTVDRQSDPPMPNGDNWNVDIRFVVKNEGKLPTKNLNLYADMANRELGLSLQALEGLKVQNFRGGGEAPGVNPAWQRETRYGMLDGKGLLNPGDSFEVFVTATVTPAGLKRLPESLPKLGGASGVGTIDNPAYRIARRVTVGMFALFYLWICWKIYRTKGAEDFAGLLFLIMGIFFFLQPTQNPWYWLWAMPFVCLAKNRGWLFVSMALFVYYLRFWFEEYNEVYPLFGVNYTGIHFFDHCVVWVEFAAVVGVLIGHRILEFFLAEVMNRKTDMSSGASE